MAISVGTDPDWLSKPGRALPATRCLAPVCTVLLQIAKAERRPVWVPVGLRSDAEDCMDELALRDSVALGEPSDLTFADCIHRLVPSIFRQAPSTDRKPRVAVIRFFMKRWSCSMD